MSIPELFFKQISKFCIAFSCVYVIIIMLWLYGQAVKTPPSHGGNSGSNPDRVTNYIKKLQTSV